MPVVTTDFAISPADGWIAVATNPTKMYVKRNDQNKWAVAVGATPPSLETQGFQMNQSDFAPEVFSLLTATTANVYVRNTQSVQSQVNGDRSIFSAIVDTP